MAKEKRSLNFQFNGPAPARLDKILADRFADAAPADRISRSQLQGLIARGAVQVDGISAPKASSAIKPGSSITIALDPAPTHAPDPYLFDLDILYDDDCLTVINKPAGLTVHPGAGNKRSTLVNALVAYYDRRGEKPEIFKGAAVRPGIVHRLDKDTSGIIVVAKDPSSHHDLSRQFAERTVTRHYLGLAFSTPRGRREIDRRDRGEIDAPIGRDPRRRTMMAINRAGRPARTHWQVLERMRYAVLLQLTLATGRTHQIRVHLNSIGSPLIGDPTYGDLSGLPAPLLRESERIGRQALHAAALGFDHPKRGERVEFSADPPADMAALIAAFRAFRSN